MNFKEITPYEIGKNPFEQIEKSWFLVAAGDKNGANCMTANWGFFGYIWNRPVFTTVIRPQRFTKKFIDRSEYASFSFFEHQYRDALTYLGRVSGKDEDKIKNSGLTPVYENQTVFFEEAELIIIGRKLYAQPMTPDCFVDSEIPKTVYPAKDFHTAYTYEIMRVLKKGE